MTSDLEPSSPAPGDGSPLSPVQLDELATAMKRAGKIRAAARAAAFTGWTSLALGALSLVLSLFSPVGVLVGGALLAVAWNELEGRKQVLRFDPQGPRRLARNQLWLLAVVAVYCGWAIYQARFNSDPDVSQLEEALGLESGFVAGATEMVYAIVFLVAALFQWGMYRYHAARISLMRSYLAETPPWVVEIQRVLLG